ncbi:D-aminoacylase [Ruminococcaceae bacterium OttesenSCG-928-D13]|nr:D-aminoacylase [Ruminococcaceae bacterium OttesenSCG-928-D13]
MVDTVIKNAQILDGTGGEAFAGDIAIHQGKIVAVGRVAETAAQLINAEGLHAAPGLIDVHGHSDMFAFADPDRASKLCQGVTTEICGQCGLGPAPTSEAFYPHYENYFKSQGAPIYPQSRSFTSFGAYLDFMEGLPLGINMAYFIPHGTVRMAVMGLSPQKADAGQLEQMRQLVREGMEKGALGLSSGLMYAPGMFADQDELAALCEVVGQYGGIYTSHIRNQGSLLEQCVADTIEAARRGGARVNISHHKASGKGNWGKVKNTIRMIHEAGFPAMHDVYPYAASSTMIRSTLPPKVQKMEQADIMAYLSNTNNHAELKQDIFHPDDSFESPLEDCGYDGILIIEAAKTKDAVGKTISQYAEALGTDPFDAFIKLVVENNLGVGYIGFSMSEDDVDTLVADPLCMFGTDGLYIPGMEMTHPRAIGTFPRILGHYVREKGVLPLAEAIRKMTSLPARFYGLAGKGLLKVGMDADVVVFNAATVADHADYRQPLLPNEGVHTVLVNGQRQVAADKPCGGRAGKLLRASFQS